MSPTVNSFVHDLVAMAKAMEEVPALESRLREMQEQLDKALAHNQGLEQNIQSYKSQIESLQTKNHDLEVARDDAEYRFLELDEKTYKILGDIEAINTLAQATREMLKPKLPEPPAPQVQDQGESHPTASTPQPDTSPTAPSQPAEQTGYATSRIEPAQSSNSPTDTLVPWSGGGSGQLNSTSTAQPEGQSAPNPTPTNVGSETGSLPPASTESAGSQTIASQSSQDTKPQGKYFGKKYYDTPTYIPYPEWVAEGGTPEDYTWRPNHQQSAE